MQLRILEILKEKGKTKYWLYIQLGPSYQNFNRLVNNQTNAIKFENLKALCDILECTPTICLKSTIIRRNFCVRAWNVDGRAVARRCALLGFGCAVRRGV